MDVREIKELLSQFDQSSLTELDLKEGTFELYLNKNSHSRGHSAISTTNSSTIQEEPILAGPMIPAPVAKEAQFPHNETALSGTEIVSPIVGIVYLQSSPTEPALKSIGDPVKKGEVVCIVEAMKVMNEILSDTDGIISDILVENEQVVEFGQPLFRVQ